MTKGIEFLSTMDNINGYYILATYSVLQILALSIATKLIEARIVQDWLKDRLKFRARNIIASTIYYSILICEFFLAFAVLKYGPQGALVPIAVSIMLLILPAISDYIFGKHGGCPCFGVISMQTGFTGKKLSFINFAVVSVLYLLNIIFKGMIPIFALIGIISCLGLALYLAAVYVQNKMSTGVRSRLINSIHIKTRFENVDKPTVLVFLSTGCPVCMAFMKHLEGLTKYHERDLNFLLVIPELSLNEDVKFAGAIIATDPEQSLSREFAITGTPTLVVINKDLYYNKYEGLEKCLIALSKIITVTYMNDRSVATQLQRG